MEKLIAELMRLFVPAGAASPALLRRRALGQDTGPLALVGDDGGTRAIAISFDKGAGDGEAGHWTRLCEAANALQAEYGFPAPAVSVSGTSGYSLWISLETPVPAAQAREFARLLGRRHALELGRDAPDADDTNDGPAPALPPFLHADSGRWAAFIHPGMGASFADEPWLDMAPPPHAQAAFLEHVGSVSPALFERALQALRPAQPVAERAPPAVPAAQAAHPGGLLLADATLEDIVRHLHARHIEPTFRHLLPESK